MSEVLSPGAGTAAGDLPAMVMSWSRQTTPLEAIERALYALAEQVSGTVAAVGDEFAASIYPRNIGAEVEGLGHRIRQEVNDQTLRLRIAERTDPIRNLVFALAFSQRDGARAARSGPDET